jgi:hypothetical protein
MAQLLKLRIVELLDGATLRTYGREIEGHSNRRRSVKRS